MDFLNYKLKSGPFSAQKGNLLIAEPFLNDPNFKRSVILLAEHNEDGSLGFVLNNPSSYAINELLPDCPLSKLPVYEGGPVQRNTLHWIHNVPELLDGTEISENSYLGTNYDLLCARLNENIIAPNQIRLFLGYSGWSQGQLLEEYNDGAWLIAKPNANLIFNTSTDAAWKDAIKLLGDDFKFLVNFPSNPQLN